MANVRINGLTYNLNKEDRGLLKTLNRHYGEEDGDRLFEGGYKLARAGLKEDDQGRLDSAKNRFLQKG